MLSCREAARRFADAPANAGFTLRMHLVVCHKCRALRRQFLALEAALGRLVDAKKEAPRAGLHEAIVKDALGKD